MNLVEIRVYIIISLSKKVDIDGYMKARHEFITKNVLKVFDEIANSYAHLRRKPWREVLHELTSRILFRESKIIFDVGAGSGRHSIPLAKLGFNVVSIDISFNMLRHLVMWSIKEGVEERVYAIVCDMRKIPIRDNVGEGLIAVASLHHIPLKKSRIRVIKEMRRIVKKGSPIVITVWSLLQPRLFVRAFYYKLIKGVDEFGDVLIPWRRKGVVFKRYYHLFTRRELTNIAKEGGLNVIKCFTYNPKSKIFPQNYVLVGEK